jgi:hypothetical protein
MTPNPIRLGVVLDSQFAHTWTHKTIEQLLDTQSIELSLIVLNETRSVSLSGAKSVLFRFWERVDKWIFRKFPTPEAYTWLKEVGETHDPLAPTLKSYTEPTISLRPDPRIENRALSDSDTARICAYNLDVLVQLGSCDLPDGIASCAKFGVWSFHYEGYPGDQSDHALFGHLFGGRRTCELVLTSSTGRLCHDRELYRGILSCDPFSLYRNLTLDCCRRSRILRRRLSDLFHVGWANMFLEDAEEDTVDQQTYSISRSWAMLGFFVSWLARVLRHAWSRLRFREQWLVACCRTSSPATDRAIPHPFTVMRPPHRQNYADPFLFVHKGKTYMFFEQFVDDGKGTIWCAQLKADGTPGEARQVLEMNYHLSYPFVFEWCGDIYLVPESWDDRTVKAYGAIDFPWRWELAAVLLSNVTAADPTILEHNGRLWLFAAGLGGLGTESSELSLFFVDSLFGEWCPHPKNPIVCDVRRARPAGSLVFQRQQLIRPGQDCSVSYGYAISLNKVEELSETDYREVPFATILPNWMPRLCATHTLNQRGEFRVWDGLSLVPRWARGLNGSGFASGADHPSGFLETHTTLVAPCGIELSSTSGSRDVSAANVKIIFGARS